MAATDFSETIKLRSREMGIQTRFMLYFGSVVVTLMACVTLVVSQRQSQSLLRETEQRGVAIANSVAGVVTNALLSYDLMGLQTAAQNTKDNTSASYVIILNKENRVAGFSDRPGMQLTRLEDEISQLVENSTDVHVVQTADVESIGVEGEHLDIAVPVFVQGSDVRWGTIRVGLPLLPVHAELAQTRLLLILLGTIAIFIVLFAARYFTSRITHPLHELAEATAAIASGDLNTAVDENLVAELRDVSRSFNKMTLDLRRSRDAIRYQNQHLENMVHERTSALREKARELERANAELMEVDRLKSDFLSNVSHELRTPLTSIRSFTEIMLDRSMPLEEDERFEFLNIVSTQAQRLTRLISDLLDLSKIEAGEFACNLETINVEDFLEPVRDTLGTLAYDKDVKLVLGDTTGLPHILGDYDRLSQVLTNLIDNALKFTPPGGTISISARLSDRRVPEDATGLFHGVVCDTPEAGEHVIISVKDTGVGIAPADRQKIFDKFGQVGNVLTDKPQGTGLGLAISGNIMIQHSGAIWVESELTHGSTFSFSVPVTRTSARPAARREPAGSRRRGREAHEIAGGAAVIRATLEHCDGKRVLVVDDEREMVSTLTDLLEPEGYRVLGCHSGRQAISKTRDLRPDLIILDVNMSEMNGYDVLRHLKSEAPTANIPVIVLSDEGENPRAVALGAAVSLPRPDLSSELFATVRTPA